MATAPSHTLHASHSQENASDGYNYTLTKSEYLDRLSEVYDERYLDPVFGGAKLIARSKTVNKIIELMEHYRSSMIDNPQQVISSNFQNVQLLNSLLSTYKVLYVDGVQTLARRYNSPQRKIVKVLGFEDAFDVLDETHRKFGHCNGVRLEEILGEEYQIPPKCYQLFPESCNVCQSNSCFGKTVRVTLIREKMHTVLLYQDVWSDYSLLRSIPSKGRHREEVTIELLKIFTDFGIPDKMIVSPRKDFYMSVLEEINKFLPCDIYVETMKPYDYYGHRAAVNKILDMLETWKTKTKSEDYTFGCYAVQVQLNNMKPNPETDCPYKKVFGKLNMGDNWPFASSSSEVVTNAEEIPTIELD